MRYIPISALILCALAAQAIPQKNAASAAPQKTAAREFPCKTPENASICYWTHGRLRVGNGDPSLRMWKVGTKRILGILSGPNAYRRDPLDNEHPELPANLERVYETIAQTGQDHVFYQVFGDFEVCPLEPEHPGWMQAVCIESAKNIVVGK